MTEPSRRDLLASLSALSLVGCGTLIEKIPAAPADSGPAPVDSAPPDTAPPDTAPIDVCAGEAPALPADCVPPTSTDGEGPYYRADAPFRDSLNIDGEAGLAIVVRGRVLDATCAPLAGLIVDLWHCKQDALYDMERPDYPCRGRLTTAEDGGFCFTTLVPPAYAGGTAGEYLQPHIHCIVWRGEVRALTTQLCFPGEAHVDGTLQDKPDDLELVVEHQPDGTGRVWVDIKLGSA